jgi:bla regulator protein blaR1
MITPAHAAWAVFNSLWQGAVIAAIAWTVLRSVRRASAAIRYHVWSAVLVATLALPAINAAMPQRVVVVAPPPTISVAHASSSTPVVSHRHAQETASEHAAATASGTKPHPRAFSASIIATTAGSTGRPVPTQVSPRSSFAPALSDAEAGLEADAVAIGRWAEPELPFAFGAWLVVAAVLFSRLGWGLWRLRSIKRGLVRFDDPAVEAMCRSIARRVSVATSAEVGSPCVIGYAHPVIALPASLARTLDAADLHRVLAHELGHVQRYDDWANLIQQCIRAALFFNPVVHLAGRALDVNREIACDDLVAAGPADRIEYAKCLTEIARRGAFAEHLVPAAGFFPDRRQIIVRIEQLLDRDHEGSARVGVVPAASAVVLVVAVAALAAHQLPALAVTAQAAHAAPAARAVPAPHAVSPERALAAAPVPENAEITSSASIVDKEPRLASLDAAQVAVAGATAAVRLRAPALSLMQARLSVTRAKMAQKISLEFTPRAPALAMAAGQVEAAAAPSAQDDFLDALAAAGYTHLSVDDLIAIRNSGVSGSYLRSLKQYGVMPMSAKALIALANSGVSASTIASLSAAGYGGLKAEDLIALQNSGVTPSLVQAAKASLRPAPSVQDLVTLATSGVTPDYLAALAKSGYAKLSAPSIVKLQNAGVSSAYLIDLAKLGHVGMSVDSLIALANAGVSPEYIRALAELGYSSVSTDDLIRMMNAGVTPDLIKRLRAHGFSDDLSVDELIKLAENGF